MELHGVIKIKKTETSKVNGGNRVEVVATVFNKKLEGTGQIVFSIFYPFNDRVKSKPHSFGVGDYYYVNGNVKTVYYKPDDSEEVKSFQSFNLNAIKGALLKLDKDYMDNSVDVTRLKEKFEEAKSGKKSSSHEDDGGDFN